MTDIHKSPMSLIPEGKDETVILLDPAFIDARELYLHVCRNQVLFENRPMQFVPITKIPDWVDDKYRSDPCVFLSEENAETDICLIVVSPCMLETIDRIIQQEIECVRYIFPSLFDIMGCRQFCTHIPGKQLIKIYKHALAIAEKLQIEVPPDLICEQIEWIERSYRFTRFKDDEEEDIPIGDFIFIFKAGMIYMIHSLAHELRHSWQGYRAEGYFKNYVPLRDAVSDSQYNYQIEEIDAEAYACLYLNNLGYNGMKYTCDPVIDPVEYRLINKRIDEIKAETIAS